MVEKRKLSTRLRAVPAWRQSSPVEEPARPKETPPSPINRQPEPTVPVVVDRAEGISVEDHKLYAHSDALAQTLNRSKHTWLGEGIFERYWTKKYKKRGQVEVENPPKEAMSKVGLCTLAIEPHVFETTVYIVRNPLQQIDPASAIPRSVGTKYESPFAIQQPSQTASLQADNGLSFSKEVSTKESSNTTLEKQESKPPVPIQPSATDQSLHTKELSNSNTESNPKPNPHTIPQHNRKKSQGHEHAGAAEANQDPVIHMLAQRAVSDPSLRLLMKRVAIGDAHQSELKVFQNHIEELKAQQRAKRMNQRPLAPGQPTSSPSSSSNRDYHWNDRSSFQETTKAGSVMPRSNFSASTNFSQPVSTTKHSQKQTAQAQSSASKNESTHFKGEIKAVVLEFSAGTRDRFLFPRHSVLQYEAGGTQVIASFLVVRKGNTLSGGTFEPDLEYYQPVTIRLSAHHPRVLEPLAGIVATQEAVRAYMNDIMDRAHRVDCNTLLMKSSEAESSDLDDESDVQAQAVDSKAASGAPEVRGMKKKRLARA